MIFKKQVSRFQSLGFPMVNDRPGFKVSELQGFKVFEKREAALGNLLLKKKSPTRAGDHEP
jgi:hypothetical protein